jgi:hypothetical protein
MKKKLTWPCRESIYSNIHLFTKDSLGLFDHSGWTKTDLKKAKKSSNTYEFSFGRGLDIRAKMAFQLDLFLVTMVSC